MDPKKWAKVKDIFSMTVALDSDARRLKLDEICGEDIGLRSEIEVLLRSNDQAEGFIEDPAFTVSDVLHPDEEPTADKVIGNYRIVREVGRGGMGTVFLAVRADGEFQHEVAIKVVSSAFLGRESVRRFRQERQILAGLNHPNIARLLDGGVTEDGLPYLAMEYVSGEPLIDYATRNDLSIEERLRVFLKICGAFAYAHGNLIVHRDVKPSNILVTPEGEPKLLDFGLAKILDIEEDRVRTATNFRALTPAYASPEQFRGDAISTSSDIYSLGVVLYELLTGSRPFDYGSVSFEKMVHLVSASAAEKPSSKVGSMSNGNTGGLDKRLAVRKRQALKGDIDNIVLMAIRKEPERRYRSVEQLAEDIKRQLNGLPIAAAEDTFRYRTSKFVRRHWIGVTSVALTALILVGGIVSTTLEARAARRAQARSETTGAFLLSILGSAAPQEKGADIKIKDVLPDAETRARTELADDPDAMAQVLTTLGGTYISLSLYPQAENDLREAAAASERSSGSENPTTGKSLAWLGIALAYQNKFVEGVTVSRRAVEIERKISPDNEDLGDALFGYSSNLMQSGDPAAALTAAQEASAIIKRTLGEQHGYYLATVTQIGMANEVLGNTDEAERFYRESLSREASVEPKYRIFIAQASFELANMMVRKGDLDEAEKFLSKAETIYRDVLGDSNANIAYINLVRGRIHIPRHEFDIAVTELRQAVDMFSVSLPPENGFVLNSKLALGLALIGTGKLADAERDLREAQTTASKSLPQGNALRAEIESALGECLIARHQFAEAETLLLGALSAQETPAASPSQGLIETRQRLATLYRASDQPSEANKFQ